MLHNPNVLCKYCCALENHIYINLLAAAQFAWWHFFPVAINLSTSIEQNLEISAPEGLHRNFVAHTVQFRQPTTNQGSLPPWRGRQLRQQVCSVRHHD